MEWKFVEAAWWDLFQFSVCKSFRSIPPTWDFACFLVNSARIASLGLLIMNTQPFIFVSIFEAEFSNFPNNRLIL